MIQRQQHKVIVTVDSKRLGAAKAEIFALNGAGMVVNYSHGPRRG